MTDIRRTKVPKRISDIEAAESQRKSRNIFVSAMDDEFEKSTKEVSFIDSLASAYCQLLEVARC